MGNEQGYIKFMSDLVIDVKNVIIVCRRHT